MKEYKIENAENKLIINFYFDTSRLVLPAFVSAILSGMLIYALKFVELTVTNIVSYIVLITIMFYITFNSYFEWKRNRLHLLEIIDEELFINSILFVPTYQIKHVYLEYCTNHYESGWTIYLGNYLGNRKNTIKKQLTERDANEIAKKISDFLNVSICKNN